ncbi:Spc98 family-domain-containing protein [Aspergillus pseudonomiae]|uniref:Spindle pole body component n=1 Tax=Aspergillus pseudonomiae TaxID=1506151 RepID=A0A5N7D2T6_9EURO|nr:Spc98 family-domain-containing protein [Aspergillus pseudonomiae]KAB8256988.1 Spc98 family-domain-containing protein [Aspergillus pseudonomiae]KAE8400720.1 Spc98 family-domain-containing protein [Aspergillus pseudonomiae]
MSVNDRRASYMSAPRPRVSSNRVGDARSGASPLQSEQLNHRGSTSSQKGKPSREQRDMMSDKRAERMAPHSKDKAQVRARNPAKESSSTGNKGEWERSRSRRATLTDGASPNMRKKDKEPVELSWNPHASLISHSTAPLATRVSVPSLASALPKSLHPASIRELSADAQETALLEDLLFVFMGFEGQYIHYHSGYDSSIEKDRLTGPVFQLPSGVDPTLRDLTLSMLKMATHYSALEAFVEVQSRAEYGAVSHALCAAIRKLLKDYLILVAQLETQLVNNPSFTLHLLHLHTMPTSQCLAQLYSLGQELLRRNGLLDQDLDESIDDFDDVDNILEQLKEGGDLVPGAMSSKKICKGGNVLRLLTERLATFSGDPTTKTLLEKLLREASRPYMAMLNEWLHHGGIKDPHAEFLVKEQKWIKREKLEEDYTDEYWEKRYTIRENEVPPQLDSVRDKVLLAGKYLNVVRECGGVDISKAVKDVPKTLDDPRFLENVNAAYTYANASLLNLLLTKNSLTTRFRSLKHYFFLDRSDFFSYFLELGASELRKPAKSVNENKLQSLLDLVLRQPGSIAAQDPFKEDVKVRMNKIGLTKWLMQVVSVSGIDQDNPEAAIEKYQAPQTQGGDEEKDIAGFDALELDYSVPFPLSLVISRKTVLRYQLIFRHLLSLRHLEHLLVTAWLDQNKVLGWRHKSTDRRLEMWKRRAWNLRAKMLVFVQQLLYFCTAEVIEPNWQNLMDRVNGTDADGSEVTVNGTKQVNRTVDELMQDHVDFLDTCLKECMLTQAKLLKIHSKLMTCCTMFASWTASSLARALATADPELSRNKASNPDGRGYDPSRISKLEDTLKRYEDHFSRHLRILMDSLNYFAATESVVLLKLAHALSSISKDD